MVCLEAPGERGAAASEAESYLGLAVEEAHCSALSLGQLAAVWELAYKSAGVRGCTLEPSRAVDGVHNKAAAGYTFHQSSAVEWNTSHHPFPLL